MDNPVTVDDLAASFWRSLTTREHDVVAGPLLNRAWGMLQIESTGLVARIDAAEVAVETVEQVIIQAVGRVLDNPRGVRQESKQQDDYTHSVTIDNSRSTGELYFTAQELRSLAGTSTTSTRGKAFIIAQGG